MSKADDQIDDLLDLWEDEYENGRDVPIDELCKECPSLAPQVEIKIAQLRQLNGLLDNDQTIMLPEDRAKRPADGVAVESNFELTEFLDGGGLGSVFVGRDETLKRDVAIKFLQREHSEITECVKQFKTECQVTSRLDHPGVVPIYGFGMLSNGQPYYVMRRISGQTLQESAQSLHEQLDGSKLTSSQRLEFHSLLSTFVGVCRTIHYAHCRGVIHRDIKPANIMVGRHGETMVLDWGLAQSVARDEEHQSTEETLSLTMNKMVANSGAGTPLYMSPEQHVGTGEVSILSDVYSLGATLFAILSGDPPFEAATLSDLRNKVIHGQVVSPKTKYKWMPSSLLSICRKAMSVHPEDRYATALHLARDIECYLADEPVTAHPENVLRRMSRWMSRNRYLTFMLASALTMGLVFSSLYSSVVTGFARRESVALVQAKHARVQSLRLAAGFAANTVALKLSDRWRILEMAAQDESLIELMQSIPEDPESVEWENFQKQLLQIKEEFHVASGNPDSWFICAADGCQMARVPAKTSIGKYYAYRDYFHGGGNTVPPNQNAGGKQHITQVNCSKVYSSSSTNTLKVALTRPIWSQKQIDPNRKFLGILGMSVALGEFQELQTGLGNEQLVMVVDTNETLLDEVAYNGLLLHHPGFVAGDSAPAVVSENLLKQMKTIREEARKDVEANPTEINRWTADILSAFEDPLNPEQVKNTHWISAFAPIMVRGRPIDIANTGWGVIVAEREQDDPGFFGFTIKRQEGESE